MLKAVVFDFDGTLAETCSSIWAEYQRVQDEMGLPKITYRRFGRELGRTWEDALVAFWPQVDVKEFSRRYRQNAERINKIPGAREALSALSGKYELAVMSSRGQTVHENLKAAGFEETLFKAVYCRLDLQYTKPDPRALTQVLEKLGVKPSEAAYVGDSVIDAECAQKAGIRFIGVLTGGADMEDFKGAGVEDVIASVAKLPSFLEGLNKRAHGHV